MTPAALPPLRGKAFRAAAWRRAAFARFPSYGSRYGS